MEYVRIIVPLIYSMWLSAHTELSSHAPKQKGFVLFERMHGDICGFRLLMFIQWTCEQHFTPESQIIDPNFTLTINTPKIYYHWRMQISIWLKYLNKCYASIFIFHLIYIEGKKAFAKKLRKDITRCLSYMMLCHHLLTWLCLLKSFSTSAFLFFI